LRGEFRRELHEELNISVSEKQCQNCGHGVLRTTHDHTVGVKVVLFEVSHSGRMKAKNEILDFRWVKLTDLPLVPLERKTKILLWLYFRFGGCSR
jgi:ADP-ribose pyrophosphatase YjhB (NUDIX family)